MLSPCVPASYGHIEQARAWQLLRLASCSHRVHLVCAVDTPVDLEQWRALAAHAHRVELVEANGLSRALECGAVWAKEPGTGRVRALCRGLTMLGDPYDAVLYTDARLVEAVGAIPARVRLLDLGCPTVPGPGRRQRAERWQALRRQAARRGDLLLAASQAAAEALAPGEAQVRVIPLATDVEAPSPAGDGADWDHFEVVLHADWRHVASRRAARGFRRRVWPLVTRVAPAATLVTTRRTPNPLGLLDRAAVVVVPVPEPSLACWPMVQAMSRARAVVAPTSAGAPLGVRSGREVLLADTAAELARACVRLLRLSSLRCELGQRAWLHVDQHLTLQPRNLPLVPPAAAPDRPAAVWAAAA